MGVERYDDSLGAWQFVHFSSTCGATQRIAILLEAQNYWPRPERLLIGLHRKPNGARGQFSFSAGERKVMNHFVVDIIIYVLPQQFRISAKFAQAAKTLNDGGTKSQKKKRRLLTATNATNTQRKE